MINDQRDYHLSGDDERKHQRDAETRDERNGRRHEKRAQESADPRNWRRIFQVRQISERNSRRHDVNKKPDRPDDKRNERRQNRTINRQRRVCC